MTHTRSAALLVITLGTMATSLHAQRPACDRTGTTSFELGRTGGNLRSDGTRIGADGRITKQVNGAWVAVGTPASRDAVAGLARLAWSNGFTKLPTAPTKPTRNPDAARDYIDVHSACGSKHVEYANGEGAPPFRELLALLQLMAR
ncbi:MAG: hypothetical protein ABIY52_14465 [Gemmatimonadaceae bacterium]